MEQNQSENLVISCDAYEKPFFNLDFTQNVILPNENGKFITTLLSHVEVDLVTQFFEIDVNDTFDDIVGNSQNLQTEDENKIEFPSVIELVEFSSLENVSPVAGQSEDVIEEYLDNSYEKMCRDQKWFSKSLLPSRRGRKRKSSSDNREDTNSNNFSCRKYRHKKSDEMRSSIIKRLRSLIKAEKIDLEKILHEHSVKLSLKDFLNFEI